MPYSHFGKYADVFKHLLLCEVLSIEQPRLFVESNSAYASYSLSETPEQRHGIYTFLQRAPRHPNLKGSLYFKLQSDAHQLSDGPRYLGSPGLAMTVLGASGGNFAFYDLDTAALESIRDFAGAHLLGSRVQTAQTDSRSALHSQIPEFPESTLIFFDPYDPFDADEGNHSLMDDFTDCARHGHPAMLWIGFDTLKQRSRNRNTIALLVDSATPLITEISVHLRSIASSHRPTNPGIFGCALLMTNLSPKSLTAATGLSQSMVQLYEGSKLFGSSAGDIDMEQLQYSVSSP